MILISILVVLALGNYAHMYFSGAIDKKFSKAQLVWYCIGLLSLIVLCGITLLITLYNFAI